MEIKSKSAEILNKAKEQDKQNQSFKISSKQDGIDDDVSYTYMEIKP